MNNFFKSNLPLLRSYFNKTQADIGFEVNKKGNTVGYWEKGDFEPSLSEVEKIAQIFDLELVELLYIDFRNVHLIQFFKNKKESKNVHPNVHPNVHLIAKNSPDFGDKSRLPLVVTMDTSGRENVVLVPVKARAGYLSGYGDPEFIKTLPTYSFPALRTGTYRAFEVEGYSNLPTLVPKDLVIGEYVESARDIREGDLHVFITKSDGIVVKRPFFNPLNPVEITLKGDNYMEHPDLVIKVQKVLEVWRCVGRFTKELRPSSSFDLLLQTMNARVTRLEDLMAKKLK